MPAGFGPESELADIHPNFVGTAQSDADVALWDRSADQLVRAASPAMWAAKDVTKVLKLVISERSQ